MKPAEVKISVVITADGNTNQLLSTVQSVLRQTYTNLECLVVSNNELDSNINSFEQLGDDKIKLLISDTSGVALVQKGVLEATGDYILLLTAGDTLYSVDSITQLMSPGLSEYGIIYGNIARLFPDGKQDTEQLPSALTPDLFTYINLNILLAALVRKNLLIEYNFFDNNINYLHAWAFIARAVLVGKEKYIHKDVCVAIISVNRSGNWYKLSNIHLMGTEHFKIKNEFPSIISVENQQSDTSATSVATAGGKGLLSAIGKLVDYGTAKYILRSLRSKIELAKYKKKHQKECLAIPIIINNKNHVTYLKRLINSLEKRGYHNIHIIDNASTYPPLLDFYEHSKYNVFRLSNNVGFCALWDTQIFESFKDQYYVYTDSDLEIVDECPDDFMVIMHYLLHKYSLGKVGLSLPTNDLPDFYANKAEVQEWEKRHQVEGIERLAFSAPVDTTFALYKPNTFGPAGMLSAFRTKFPYSARHLPWYENTQSLTEEQLYYYKNARTSSHWSSKIKVE
ncbi:glycosyltransferase [Hymenobacter setariae]|uniref:Glycosyltransferase n=1 Tax=Hymenobacter setariae TaxID=2594794 RepID=A0A558BP62_9BACT|nr:glycosyltransferase [Hymenobacter setariae]TVT38263.1 glycosyltransferase [Hymenobacter setariae]